MKRRDVLGLVLTMSLGAGCLGARSGPTPSPEEVINYEELSPEAQRKFTAALEQNGLKECEIALLEIDHPYISYQREYYVYGVQHGNSGNTPGGCDNDFLEVEKADNVS